MTLRTIEVVEKKENKTTKKMTAEMINSNG